jgi:hypothetical protein
VCCYSGGVVDIAIVVLLSSSMAAAMTMLEV